VPAGVTAAQMNMLYTAAVMILDRAVGPDQFDEARLADPRILDIIGRLQVAPDEAYDRGGDASRHCARVEIVTQNGRAFRREVLNRPGSPANPMTGEALRAKFAAASATVLPPGRAREIEQFIMTIEDRDVRDLTTFLVPPVAGAAS
jgi:aconitate decarboxylase